MLVEALLLGLGLAHAAPVPVSHAISYNQAYNDPFMVRRGLRYDLRLDLAPQLAVGAGLSAYPSLGRRDWRASAESMADFGVLATSARLMGEATVFGEMVPVRAELGGGRTSEVRARLGVGAVRTYDAFFGETAVDAAWLATQRQFHPAYEAALLGRLRAGKIAFEGGVRRVTYVEVMNSGFLEFKSNSLVQLGVAWSR